MPNSLPPPVRKLLEGPVDSFEKLELVLALFRAATPQTLEELCTALQLPGSLVHHMLDEMARARLITLETADEIDIVRLTPRDDDGAAINELARMYADERLVVMTAMSTIAMNRIRGMAARTFADAFRIRKNKDDDA